MNRKEDYRDMEKYHKACQRQHRRYYSKTSFLYPSHPWTAEEDALVIKHEITDSELSEKIGRSVGAIHNRRYELKSWPDRHKTLHGTLTATLLDMTVNHKPQ